MNFNLPAKKIYSVTQLTHEIHESLESEFSFFWVSGEISNFAAPSSGHFYFSLKDKKAVISSVIFKNQQKNLKFRPENGLEVIGFGRLSVYPPRGSYQVIFEYLEPKGLGSLQLTFEQTKEKLKSEGIFDDKYKKNIPFFAEKISLITSPTGAALRDMLKIFSNRFDNFNIEIYPVTVQGEKSEHEIAEALNDINIDNTTDIIILARGGGSLEDLMSFNSEKVARAIFDSKIPVITGVGHETDFTIADFAADLRAPTPTAAAEYSIPDKKDLQNSINTLNKRLILSFQNSLVSKKSSLKNKHTKLKDPKKEIINQRLLLDDKILKLERRIKRVLNAKKEKMLFLDRSFSIKKLEDIQVKFKEEFNTLEKLLFKNYFLNLENNRNKFEKTFTKLYELGPYTILKRGYSITRDNNTKKILRSVKTDIKKDDKLEIILHDGSLICSVDEIKEDKKS